MVFMLLLQIAMAPPQNKCPHKFVHPEGFSRGNPNIIIPLQEFDATCDWLEQHTLIGYFVGMTPPEAMLRE